jgi:hypothetical protein
MKTKEEFVKHWRAHLAGLALFGVASEQKDGALVRATKILDIPAEVEALLGRMYDHVTKEPPKLMTAAPVNGAAKPQTQAAKVNP